MSFAWSIRRGLVLLPVGLCIESCVSRPPSGPLAPGAHDTAQGEGEPE
jgi:hypothetical protein